MDTNHAHCAQKIKIWKQISQFCLGHRSNRRQPRSIQQIFGMKIQTTN